MTPLSTRRPLWLRAYHLLHDVAFIGGLVILCLTAALVAVAAVGVAVGLFMGAIFWAFQKVAGPIQADIPDEAVPWICLAIVGCALAAALGKRRKR